MYDVTLLNDITKDGVRQIFVQTNDEVCSQNIFVAVKNGIIEDAGFVGGCPGNTKGVAILVKGMKVTDAIAKLEGIKCGNKPTSCPDQLAKALKLTLK